MEKGTKREVREPPRKERRCFTPAIKAQTSTPPPTSSTISTQRSKVPPLESNKAAPKISVVVEEDYARDSVSPTTEATPLVSQSATDDQIVEGVKKENAPEGQGKK